MSERVDGYGPLDAKILVVGEAPGETEVREGRPFVGPAGKMLRSFLLQVGIDPEEVRYNNICKYWPPGNKISAWFKNGEPNEQVLAGMMELDLEIKRMRPNVILACGSHPLWAMTGKARWNKKESSYVGIMDWRGSILPYSGDPSIWVVPTFHPSYILQEGRSDHGTWMVDLARARMLSTTPGYVRSSDHKELVLDPRGDDLEREIQWLTADKSKILTFDIEYIGSNLLCVGMTISSDRAVCWVMHDQTDINRVREILTSGQPLCAQNGMFDCSILEWHYGIECIQYLRYDTMLAAHSANPELPKGLDYLTSIYTDQPYYKDMVDWKKIKSGEQPISDVWQYNAIDTWTTHKIMEEQLADDLLDPAIRATFDFEMLQVRPLWEMSKRGIRIDVDGMEKLKLTLQAEAFVYGKKLELLAGSEVNVKSIQQVGKLLFDQLRVPKGGTTPGGAYKVDDTTLAACLPKCTTADQREAIQLIRDIRERRDLISKFCNIELEDDGRMRGHYNPAGTDTGRLASRQFFPTGRGANQQNMPRDKRVRRVFIPDPNRLFGYNDLERAESLVVAHLSHDPMMLADHAPGVDAHKRLGAFLFGCPIESITDDQRYMSKRTRHAGNYMLGWMKFMMSVNADAVKTGITITAKEAKRLIYGYKEYNIMLQTWWNDTYFELKRTGTLSNLLGRKRRFFDDPERCLPTAVAYKPQSTVGDTLNVALLNLEGVICPYAEKHMDTGRILQLAKELKQEFGFEALSQIHDAVGFQYLEEYTSEVMPRMRELMTIPLFEYDTGEQFTIPIECAMGPNWGDVKVWHG